MYYYYEIEFSGADRDWFETRYPEEEKPSQKDRIRERVTKVIKAMLELSAKGDEILSPSETKIILDMLSKGIERAGKGIIGLDNIITYEREQTIDKIV